MQKLSLDAQARELLEQAATAAGGRAAQTVSVYVLHGRVQMKAAGQQAAPR